MAWRDELQPASFRGAAFFVSSHDASTGRKIIVHEFPLRDTAFVEDMGRRNRVFSIEAYVIGSDYMAARDALIDALEAEGPGRLVHPYRGEITVAVGTVSSRESTTEGGFCAFQIEFVEAESQTAQPSDFVDPAGLTGGAADALIDGVAAFFEDVFSVLLQPQFAIDSLLDIVDGVTGSIDKVLSPVVNGVQALAKLQASIFTLKTEAAVLLREPAKLAGQVRAVFEGIKGQFGSPLAGVKALTSVAALPQPVPAAPQTTPVRLQEYANQAALMTLFRTTAAAEAARAVLDVPFESYEDAVAIRDTLLAAMDTEMASASDPVYYVLADLAAALVRSVPGDTNSLARLVSVIPATAVPAVVLSYRLYGDLRSESDIVARNAIRNPLFVPGGRELQVLGRV
jgi:prophage DNA circulation protein